MRWRFPKTAVGLLRLLGAPSLVVAIGAAVSTIGLWMAVTQVVGNAWPSLLPLVVLAYGAVFTGAGLWARWRSRRPAAPWMARRVGWWALPLMAAAFVVWTGFTGVESRRSYTMTWAYGEPPVDAEGERHVVLRFVEFPEHVVGFYSDTLAAYLATLPTAIVDVEFAITRDFGRVAGTHAVRIGTCTRWRTRHAYGGTSGTSGVPGPSPW